jgi:hypothetical protein
MKLNRIMKSTSLLPLPVAFLALTSTSFGGFVILDNFQSYLNGDDLNGVNNWVVSSDAVTPFTVAQDPAGGSNKVGLVTLLSNPNSHAVYNSSSFLQLPSTDTGTLFLRFRFDTTTPSTLFGLKDSTKGLAYSDLSSITRVGDLDSSVDVYNAGYVEATSLTNADAWYNAWVVADSSTKTFDVYLQSDDDADFATQTLIYENASYRNSSSSLDTFYLKMGGNHTGNFWVDDIYFDATGANLMNAVPEPSTYALIAGLLSLGGLGVIRHRRRQLQS